MSAVTLTTRNGVQFQVDDDVVEMIAPYRWAAYVLGRSRNWYVMASNPASAPGPKRLYLHRFITAAPKGMDVDHIDGDGLNNVRGNLRVCEHRFNLANQIVKPHRNLPKGVYMAENGRYRAKIKVNQQSRHLGTFTTVRQAADAYDAAALAAWGEYARLNRDAA
jgi:hypothetical protein